MELLGPPLFWGMLGRGWGEMAQQDLSQPRVVIHTIYRAEESRPLPGSVVQGPLLQKPTPSLGPHSKQGDPTLLPSLGGAIAS